MFFSKEQSANALPPGPKLQRLNLFLHQEPFASLAHTVYWSFFLQCFTPIATLFLHIHAACKIVLWALGWTGENAYPSKDVDAPELAVVITGCDSGFGKELALLADKASFQVFAGCLFQHSFDHFKGTSIVPLLMDVTNEKQINDAADKVKKWISAAKPGKNRFLHALCNNAGVLHPGLVDWSDISVIQKVMDVNYFGIIRCCKTFLPILKQQAREKKHAGSRVINLASMAGKVIACGNLTSYCASKHAVVAFSHGLRVDLAPFGIQVCTVCPTFHGTPMVQTFQGEHIDTQWAGLSKETREEYGDEYLDFTKQQSALAHRCMWRMDVVVQQLLKTLTTRKVPAEVLVGMDAKYFYPVTRMLPHWIVDLILLYLPPRPVPACMKGTGSS